MCVFSFPPQKFNFYRWFWVENGRKRRSTRDIKYIIEFISFSFSLTRLGISALCVVFRLCITIRINLQKVWWAWAHILNLEWLKFAFTIFICQCINECCIQIGQQRSCVHERVQLDKWNIRHLQLVIKWNVWHKNRFSLMCYFFRLLLLCVLYFSFKIFLCVRSFCTSFAINFNERLLCWWLN